MKFVNLEMNCSRSNHDLFHIDIRCQDSGTRLLDMNLTPEQFSLWITGRHMSDLKGQVGDLERVGKVKVRERRTLAVNTHMSRGEAQEYVTEYGQEDGWLVDSYMGSQSSIVSQPGGRYNLNYAVYKFVDRVEE